MDLFTGSLIAGILTMIFGAGGAVTQDIMKNRKNRNNQQPDPKQYPGAVITKSGKGNWTIKEKVGQDKKGKPIYGQPYVWRPTHNPVKFSDESVKQIDNLPPNQRVLVDMITDAMQKDSGDFFGGLENISDEQLKNIASGQLPSADQLGFPPQNNVIPELMRDTDFSGIEQDARSKFHNETIPALAERFAGIGATRGSGLIGSLGKAASDLESQLGALRGKYGLERASTLGSLAQRQQALDVGRAESINNLGMAQQAQQFGQQQGIANLGLANNAQNLTEKNQRNALLSTLLTGGRYDTGAGSPSGWNQLMQLGAGITGSVAPVLGAQQGNSDLIARIKALEDNRPPR